MYLCCLAISWSMFKSTFLHFLLSKELGNWQMLSCGCLIVQLDFEIDMLTGIRDKKN